MITITDAFSAIKQHIPDKSFDRFKIYVSKHGFTNKDSNIIPFFHMPVTAKDTFLDYTKIPTWKLANSWKNGVSAVSTALDTPLIKKAIGDDDYKKIKDALKVCYNAAQNPTHVPKDTMHNERTTDKPIEEDDPAFDDVGSDGEDVVTDKEDAKRMEQVINGRGNPHEQVHALRSKCDRLEQENAKLHARIDALEHNLALFETGIDSYHYVSTLQYTVDMLLAQYEMCCPSEKLFRNIKSIVERQITLQSTIYSNKTVAKNGAPAEAEGRCPSGAQAKLSASEPNNTKRGGGRKKKVVPEIAQVPDDAQS